MMSSGEGEQQRERAGNVNTCLDTHPLTQSSHPPEIWTQQHPVLVLTEDVAVAIGTCLHNIQGRLMQAHSFPYFCDFDYDPTTE